MADYETTGISVRDHPLAQLRAGLTARGFVTTAALEQIESGTPISIAGLTVARQRPASAKGVVFLLLEDEHGLVNLVLFGDVYEKHRLLARTEPLLEAHGKLERRERNINVIVERLMPLGTPSRRVLPAAGLQPVGSAQNVRGAAAGGRRRRHATARDRPGRPPLRERPRQALTAGRITAGFVHTRGLARAARA